MRRISQSQRRCRVASRTRRRTFSPRASISAAVASPVLIRKLRVLLRDHGAADASGRGSRRGRSAPRPCGRADWRRWCRRCALRIGWRRLARGLDLGQPRARSRRRRPRSPASSAPSEDPVLRHAAMAIGEAEIAAWSSRCSRPWRSSASAASDDIRPARGHRRRHSCAARRRWCRECRRGIRARRCPASARHARDVEVERRGTGADIAALDCDLGEAAAEADAPRPARRRRAPAGWSRRRSP